MKTTQRILGIIIALLTFLLTNRGLWICLTDLNNPLSFCVYNYPIEELVLYLLACGLVILLLKSSEMGQIFLSKWRENPLIPVFVSMAILSIFWSVHPATTLFYLFILLFSTFLASFLGTFFSSQNWLVYLTTTGAIIVIASGLLSIIFPHAVIMGPPHEGSWRGIYWHKNIAGSLMAFWNAVFLLFGLWALRRAKWQTILSAVLYFLSLVFVFLSLSAAGIAIWLGLNLTIVILLLWSRARHYLKRSHYILLGCIAVVILILTVANLNFILGRLNREASLTGRIPLWNYLIQTTVKQKPILGYGLSAIWDDRDFRQQVTLAQGWPFTITNGHNGFMDILLGLGIVGLFFAVLLLGVGLYRTGKLFIADNKVENLLPLMSVVYFLLANLSISFFLEMDSFHWVLLVTSIFLCTPSDIHKSQ